MWGVRVKIECEENMGYHKNLNDSDSIIDFIFSLNEIQYYNSYQITLF